MDADKGKSLKIGVALDQLMRNARDRPLQSCRVEQNLGRLAAREMRRHRAPFRPLGAGLKGR